MFESSHTEEGEGERSVLTSWTFVTHAECSCDLRSHFHDSDISVESQNCCRLHLSNRSFGKYSVVQDILPPLYYSWQLSSFLRIQPSPTYNHYPRKKWLRTFCPPHPYPQQPADSYPPVLHDHTKVNLIATKHVHCTQRSPARRSAPTLLTIEEFLVAPSAKGGESTSYTANDLQHLTIGGPLIILADEIPTSGLCSCFQSGSETCTMPMHWVREYPKHRAIAVGGRPSKRWDGPTRGPALQTRDVRDHPKDGSYMVGIDV